jgi:hypothetical protein
MSEETFHTSPMDSWIGESLALACGGGVMELVDDKWMKNMTPLAHFWH